MTPLIETRGLSYCYPDGSPALNGISLKLRPGERLALIGANGSGKSTLLMLISGCFEPKEGEILLKGETVRGLKTLRGVSGMVFQDPDDQLFMPSVLEDVAFGLTARDVGEEQARAKALLSLEALGASGLSSRSPHRMSGGEKRIAALAGILVMQPEIILLDEPTSSLDPKARREAIKILNGISGAMMLATHDFELARRVCGRVAVLQNGCVEAEGAPDEILKDERSLARYGL
ncbi:MAG: energy-coupling factor ABC transporter ATP-binding protein [Synergistaceae bacterium]|jgi:cobalt/nickel transport system ATP-binding protein|nr:energy-coupling factor ABC transporter ATP-binding protein [Synergistaceae bacterium]